MPFQRADGPRPRSRCASTSRRCSVRAGGTRRNTRQTSTLARVLCETATALTLKTVLHGGPEVAIVIAELPLEIGFLVCDDTVAPIPAVHRTVTRARVWNQSGHPCDRFYDLVELQVIMSARVTDDLTYGESHAESDRPQTIGFNFVSVCQNGSLSAYGNRYNIGEDRYRRRSRRGGRRHRKLQGHSFCCPACRRTALAGAAAGEALAGRAGG